MPLYPYKQIASKCYEDDFIVVVNLDEENPAPKRALIATYWKSSDDHLWRITRDDNGEEIKEDLGLITL